MPKLPLRRISSLLVLVAFGLVAVCYAYLPDPMPTHFDMAGKPDGFTPKPLGPFVMPTLMAIVQLVFVAVLRKPALAGVAGQERTFDLVHLAVIAFLFVVTLATTAGALGFPLPIQRVLAVAVGVLVIVLGRAMSALPRNGLVGIRTPWTLASDEVWAQTHKLGARLFVIAGLVAVIGGFAGLDLLPIVVALGTAAVAPVVYSFRVWRKLEGMRPPKS